MDHQTHIDPPVPEPYLHVQIAPTVSDAQSAPNAVFVDGCQTHVSVADPPYEIPLTQNHLSKCLNCMVFESLPRSLHLFLLFFPHFCNDVAGDIPENMDVEVAPMVLDAQSAPNAIVGDACQTHVVVVDPPHEIPLT